MKSSTSRNALHRIPTLLLWSTVIWLLAAAVGAQETATRARKVMRERKVSAAKPKPKVLTAREHEEAKAKLAELGYWLTKAEDSYRQALIAFQKIEGLKPTGKLTFADLDVLRAAHPPAPKETKTLEKGHIRVEVDLQRQVLFVVNHENTITKILSVSSGNGKEFTSEGFTRDAVTPAGRFNVTNKIKGWRKSPLGLLYYPNYFLSGLAIHGSTFVPPYPDSHGCIRIPMFAAEEFYRLVEIGTEILIYGQPEVKAPPPELAR
jgi:lipoprotein-anchoring transpeptidase ErfK/SrfK